jgi:ribonuclease HI
MTEKIPDFFLYTDGSGYQDGYGGAAALVLSAQHNIWKVSFAAYCGTTVERAEFEALLMGLQTILVEMKWDSAFHHQRLERMPATVQWITDRQSLAEAVRRDAEGNPVYSRRSTPDLWARFSFYERIFQVDPVFMKRETNAYHNVVDRFASDSRVLVKDYMELPNNSMVSILTSALPPSNEKPSV